MDLVKLAVRRKHINEETSSSLKERRSLAERYKFNYDRYESCARKKPATGRTMDCSAQMMEQLH